MKTLLLLLALSIPTSLVAQNAAFNGYCVQGAVPAQTSGLPSSNRLQGLIPQCSVSVFLTGTTTLATIYSDGVGTILSNPFTADVKAKWLFYAAQSQGYDVTMSGGIPPLIFSSPVTLTDLIFGGGGGGGSFVAAVNGTPLITSGSINLLNSTSVTVTNPSTNQVQFTVVNPGCQMQGVAGTFNVSDGSGGCVSAPADYGATETGSFLFTPVNGFDVNGVGSTWNLTGGMTVNAPSQTYDTPSGSEVSLSNSNAASFTDGASGRLDMTSGAVTLSGVAGITVNDNGSTLDLEELSASGAFDLGSAGAGDIFANGLFINDSGSTGIQMDTAGPFLFSADTMQFTTTTDTDFTLNSEIVCTASNGACTTGNLPGGALGSLPYQSAASTTTFIASPTTSGHAFVPMWQPSGSAIAPTAVDLGTYIGTNVIATSPLTATPTTLGVTISCATCSTSATGTTVSVNGGSTLGSLNLNGTTPSADAIYLALLPKISGSNAIIEAPYATGAAFGVVEGDASTLTITSGVISCTTATSSQIGCVKPDGTIITDTAGAITVPKTSSSVFGVAKVDGTTITASAGVISATSAISGGTSGEVAIFGSASTITSAIALGTTGSDIPQLSSGLLNNSVVNWAAPSAIGTGTPAAGTFSALTLSAITGSAQCLHVNTSGVVSGTGSDCGSGGSGSPGGSSGQVQWNNGGVFAGFTMSGDATLVASTGTITVTKSGGVAFGSAAFQPSSAFQASLGYTPAHSGANSDITSLTGLTTPLSPSQGGTGSAGLTGYMYGNGASIVTASTTIPGSAITGNIPGNAANLSGTPALPNGTTATTQTAGDSSTKLATDAFVTNAIGTGLTKICSGTITLSGTLTTASTATVGNATCTGLASTDIIIATFNGNIFTVGGWIPSTNGVLSVSLQPVVNSIHVNAENNTTLSQTIGSGAVLNYLVVR